MVYMYYRCIFNNSFIFSKGSGIPEGLTCYVLTQEDRGTWRIWNPSTAQCYDARDPFSPLGAVYILINQENVSRYGNALIY